jgi:uncharacterized repeat protein (TIGR03847 family)
VGESFELDPVDWITAGALGEPGRRTFFVQARKGPLRVALMVEKSQVQVLSQLAQQLLAQAGRTVTPDDLDEEAQQLDEPVESVWRAGSLGLGMDPAGERFLLEAEELVEDGGDAEAGSAADVAPDRSPGGLARFWMDREQLAAMAAYAAYVVQAGARPRCPLCTQPVDAGEDHVCPALNGHPKR